MQSNTNWAYQPTPTDYTTITRIPFLAWNKLEGRARSQNLDRTTRAEVYDPLWFLTRQWQLGELKGEDVGSSISAKIAFESTRPSHIGKGVDGSMTPIANSTNFHNQHPVASISYLNFSLTLQQRVHTGKYFLKLCRQIDNLDWNYCASIINSFPVDIPETPDVNNWSDDMKSVKHHAQRKLLGLGKLYKNRIPDGMLIYLDLKGTAPTLGGLSNELRDNYIQFIEKLYPQLNDINSKDGWLTDNLGYEFKWGYPKDNEGEIDHLILGNKAASTNSMDWHAADVLNTNSVDLIEPITDIGEFRESKTFEVILSRAKYSGMPAKRWWEMEEGKIDLGNIEGDKSEIIKQILTEFSALHSSDWFMIPIKRKEQELITVKGILVKDVFGEYTFIKNTLNTNIGSSSFSDAIPNAFDWNLFHHEVSKETESILNNSAGYSLSSCFMLGSSRTVVSSEPVERIEFIRDEMDNRVWAVESVIASELGGGMNGTTASDELLNYLKELVGEHQESISSPASLIYKIGNSIPENYIPFVPVIDGMLPAPYSSRSIALQRGWLPRTIGESVTRVRPRTRMLRWKLNSDDLLLDDLGNPIITGTQGNPLLGVTQSANLTRMLIKEELIPRSGLTITDRYYYGRDYNGNMHLWLGRSVKNGTEANSASLDFDNLNFKSTNQ